MPKKKLIQLEKTNARLAKELLQKERELKIESSLEKVRVIAMAMKHRDDMLGICKTISNQLKLFGVKEIRNVQTAIFYKEKGTYMNYEYYTKHKKTFITETVYTQDKIHKDFAGKMLKGKGEFIFLHIRGKKVKEWLKEQKKTNVFIDKYLETASSLNYYWYSLGPVALGISTYHPLTKGELTLFRRFVHVFELAYGRYADIENAEAQAREALIQASLEKVRAGSLAMHKSDELIIAGELLLHELRRLGIECLSSGYVVMDKEEKMGWTYAPNPATGKISEPLGLTHTETREMRKVLSSWEKKEPMSVVEMDEQETIAHQTFVAHNGMLKNGTNSHWITAEQLIALSPKRLLLQNFNFDQGYLMIVGGNRLNEKEIELMLRFTKVFQQTYTRFLDLQKAEAQAREAQIEAALERVRVRTMAMQKSTELADAAFVIFQQLQVLGEDPIQITIGIMNETERVIELSLTDWTGGGGRIDRMIKAGFDEPVLMHKSYTAWKEGRKSLVLDIRGPELEQWISYRNKISGTKTNHQVISERRAITFAFFSKGHLSFSTPEPRPRESVALLERFATEFDMTYTRFLDLQKAEAQTREAQIEAALERVRSRSIGMRKSEELKEVIKIVYDQFIYLNIHIDHAGFVVDYTPKGDWHFWIADKQDIPSKISTPYFDSVWGNDFNKAKEKGTDFFTTHLNFEDKNKFYQKLLSFVPGLPEEAKSFYLTCLGLAGSTALSETVSLYIENFSGIPYSDEENKILIRFGKVFQQTYTRFLDLLKSEASAKEAIKRASIDRIRGDIASMRTIADLDRITPLIWNELTILGIPFIRCGVFIMDDEQQQIHTFLSTPEGHAVAAFHLSYDTPGNFSDIVQYWRQKKIYVNHWHVKDFSSLADMLIQQGAVQTREEYLSSIPAEGIYLHFIPFYQGMLYVGNISDLNKEEINTLQSFADAFSTAYARYEDFNKLEAAKKLADSALNELRATQKQLVQSEKMASLGELTAGIAHEIQNPLNFVNNFSEVNNELIEELTAERAKPKTERDEILENEILYNIKQNLEKINNHGKRADGIVKGMLQHSRSSSGQKELTDINALADEYLRLAYHGFRAKEKFFNAKFETDFDKRIEKINVVPEDIGRVLLNLINNAFYAVNEKRKLKDAGYEAAIKMTTIQSDNQLSITVSDNGNGIPKNLVDKIFQPFFTTKPTGSGTGLGLSLAYDIIKAHGGDIKVATKEGEGSEFMINLPVF
jgi:signal transduction histidine kinase